VPTKRVKREKRGTDSEKKSPAPPPLSARSKALGAALSGIEGFRRWSEVEYPRILPTRITSLNRALRSGGIPGGMLGDVFGKSGGGKSLLCAELLGDVHASGGWGLFVDAECRAVDLAWYAAVCGDLSEVAYYKPRTFEEAIERYQKYRAKFRRAKEAGKVPPGAFCAAVFDSVLRLTPEKELEEIIEGKVEARGYPLRAMLTSKWLDKILPTLERDEILVFVRREVENLDAGPGQKRYKVKGGVAIEYDAGWRLRVSAKSRVKTEDAEPRICGQKHEVEIVKNSLGPHLEETAYFYSASGLEPETPKGLDPAREVREESIHVGLAKYRSGKGYLYRGELVAPSKKAYLLWLREEEDGRPRFARVAEELGRLDLAEVPSPEEAKEVEDDD